MCLRVCLYDSEARRNSGIVVPPCFTRVLPRRRSYNNNNNTSNVIYTSNGVYPGKNVIRFRQKICHPWRPYLCPRFTPVRVGLAIRSRLVRLNRVYSARNRMFAIGKWDDSIWERVYSTFVSNFWNRLTDNIWYWTHAIENKYQSIKTASVPVRTITEISILHRSAVGQITYFYGQNYTFIKTI